LSTPTTSRRSAASSTSPAAGKLIAVDVVVQPGPHIGKIFDAYMVVLMPGGVERTEEEFGALFASCGFKLTRVIPTRAYLSIVEGVPV
jgi:hypothetical protein